MSSHSNYRTIFLVLAALFTIWGIFGIMDKKNATYSGYSTDGNYTILEVEDGSPAASGGLEVGDKIISIGGIAMEDSKARNKQNRNEIGETKTFLVDRNGAEAKVNITYTAQNSKGKTLGWFATIIGFLFIFFGVRAYLKAPTTATLLFGIFGLFFGFNFLDGPYFASHIVRNVEAAITMPFILLGFVALLHFMLTYPRSRAFLNKKLNRQLLYVPAILLAVIVMGLIAFQPDSTSQLNTIMRLLFGLVILFYFGWAVVAMIQNYMRASADERSGYGLNIMLWGTIIGLVPILLIVIINTASPQMIIPGSDYVFLTFGLIPIAYGLALDKGAAAAE